MAFKSIKDFPESTSPSGEWFALVDDGTGCYYKVKLKNLPGGGFTTTSSTTTRLTTTSTTTTAAGTTSTTTTRLTTSTTTTAVPASTTTSTTSSTSTSSTSSTTSTTTTIVYDPDAQAFFTAAGITDVTQKGAVNGLVQALKGYSLWTKMRAIYPFVGGTALNPTPHTYNLKNPATYQITFSGVVAHSANGVQFDGSTGYGDTKFSISDFASTTNLSYGVYIRTQGTGFDMGVYDFVGLVSAYNFIWSSSRRFYYNSNSSTPQFLTWSSSGAYGFIAGSINGTAGTVYRNGALGQSGTTPNDAIPTPGTFWYIGNVNDGSNVPEPSSWSNNQYAFAYLGDSLTTLEMTSLYTAVQNYQIALSRQV